MTVLAKPGPGVFSYAVEEQVPPGVQVTNVTEGGEYDLQSRLVRWGPFFDAEPRTLSYSVVCSEPSMTVAGRISMDGASVATEGPDVTRAGVRLLSVKALPAGKLELDLGMADGRSYAIQTSTNLLDWTTLSTLTNDSGVLRFGDADGFKLPQKFYRLIGVSE
ncbi:MAG: hypothetical protein AB9869_14470 [Verrucomicrobiia bacterium]